MRPEDLVLNCSTSGCPGVYIGRMNAIGIVANAAVIGPVSAAAARELGYRVTVEADPFTVSGLVNAISGHFEGGQHA